MDSFNTSQDILRTADVSTPEDVDLYDVIDMQQAVVEYYSNPDTANMAVFSLMDGDDKIFEMPSFFTSHDKVPDVFDSIPLVEKDQTIIEYNLDFLNTIINSDSRSRSFYNDSKLFPMYDDKSNAVVGRKTDYFTAQSFIKPLQLEAAKAYREQEFAPENFPLRSEYLKTTDDFLNPDRPVLGSGGAVLVMKTQESFKLLLGKRSDSVDAAPNMISTFPAGSIEVTEDFDPLKTVEREFIEEFYTQNKDIGQEVLDSLEHQSLSSGWSLIHGSLIFDYMLYTTDSEVYELFKDSMRPNEELADFIEIELSDVDRLQKYINLETMSGDAIHVVFYALDSVDSHPSLPDLPYTVETDWI